MHTNIQRICVKAKSLKKNPNYNEWDTANIVMFIPENDKALAIHKALKELHRRHWEFITYTDKSTLIESRVEEEGGEVWDAYQYAKEGNIFFSIFPDHFAAGNKDNIPIRPVLITEFFMDTVVKGAGGRRLTSEEIAVGNKNADYIIGDFVFELKDLQQEGLEKKPHQQKIAELFLPYFPNETEINIDTSILSRSDYIRFLDIVSKPIKSHIRSASKQIKNTRTALGNPNLKGGIIFLNTGFGTFPHNDFANQVERYAKKDSSQFQAIITISIFSYTNGFDTYALYKLTPINPSKKEVLSIKTSFNKLYEEMLSNILKDHYSEPMQYAIPLKPVVFSWNGVNFIWNPPMPTLPWDDNLESSTK